MDFSVQSVVLLSSWMELEYLGDIFFCFANRFAEGFANLQNCYVVSPFVISICLIISGIYILK